MLVWPTITNKPRIVRVRRVEKETPTIKSLTFYDKACSQATPGQFVMVWVPGVDEIPMSLSTMGSSGYSAITVKRVGDASVALHNLKRGDLVGIRGPYGRGFTLTTGNVMIVGGGIGMAPLAPLAENLSKNSTQITLIIGAVTREELLFLGRMKRILSKVNAEVVAATEDGSYGLKGLATDPVEPLLKRERFGMVYTCGPESMMQKMFQLAERHHTPVQASLERIMRCSIGLCGSCVIGGFRVCRDGPVFGSEQLRKVKDEFGAFKRDFSGRKVRV